MQKVIKLEPRQEVTPSGAMRTVYKRTEYRPGHPDYEEEKALSDSFLKSKKNPIVKLK